MDHTQSALSGRRFLDGTEIELIRDTRPALPPKHVMFDFDGTLSLIREGWQKIMAALIIEMLRKTESTETDEELSAFADNFVAETTGLQTIYQMIRLAGEIEARGAKPDDPLDYKHEFNRRLLAHIARRRELLRNGKISSAALSVPYAHDMLHALTSRGVTVYLASGTDLGYVREEASLLGIDTYFGEHIHGAVDDYKSFSKEIVIRRIIEENNITGDSFVGFGDGFVDMESVKAGGGTAVGVASDETGTTHAVDEWKRTRLSNAGADIIIPDYRDFPALISYLWQSE